MNEEVFLFFYLKKIEMKKLELIFFRISISISISTSNKITAAIVKNKLMIEVEKKILYVK